MKTTIAVFFPLYNSDPNAPNLVEAIEATCDTHLAAGYRLATATTVNDKMLLVFQIAAAPSTATTTASPSAG